MTIESLLEESGGFGRFQSMVVFGLALTRLNTGWSMLQMSFAGFIPDWHCVVGHDNGTYYHSTLTLKKCSMNNSLTGFQEEDCNRHLFEGHYSTVMNEWDLVCDKKWIKATITSIQMSGVLVGSILSGQLADLIGRKKTLLGIGLFHSALNIGAAFSTSWEMFAAFRFFIGGGIGGLLVVSYPYPLEFTILKWRPLVGVLPIWTIGSALFSLAALFLEDWSHLHIACGVLGVPGMFSYFYCPESVRWLAIKGRYEEAEEIVGRMATMNGKVIPSKTRAVLQEIYKEEQESRSKGKKYSYWDLFNTWRMAKISFVFCFNWAIISMVYYGISFGVTALAGNIFLNIFLLSVVELPSLLSTFYFNNKIGRKWTASGFLLIAAVSAGGCLVVQLALSSDDRQGWVIGFSYAAKMGIGAGWGAIMVWSSESYPTVVRTLGYGLVNSSARLGGILAPFVIDLDNHPAIAYAIITAGMLMSISLCLTVPETKGQLLADSLKSLGRQEKNGDIEIEIIQDGGDFVKSADDSNKPPAAGDSSFQKPDLCT